AQVIERCRPIVVWLIEVRIHQQSTITLDDRLLPIKLRASIDRGQSFMRFRQIRIQLKPAISSLFGPLVPLFYFFLRREAYAHLSTCFRQTGVRESIVSIEP